jgi:hypothetical protein
VLPSPPALPIRLAVALAAGTALAACTPQPVVTPVYDEATRALLRLDYDYDANGIVDVRTYIKGGRPFRLVGDTNQDGVADRCRGGRHARPRWRVDAGGWP